MGHHGRSYGLNLPISTFCFLSKYEDFCTIFSPQKNLYWIHSPFFSGQMGKFDKKKNIEIHEL
jgi:hypothetical protein